MPFHMSFHLYLGCRVYDSSGFQGIASSLNPLLTMNFIFLRNMHASGIFVINFKKLNSLHKLDCFTSEPFVLVNFNQSMLFRLANTAFVLHLLQLNLEK